MAGKTFIISRLLVTSFVTIVAGIFIVSLANNYDFLAIDRLLSTHRFSKASQEYNPMSKRNWTDAELLQAAANTDALPRIGRERIAFLFIVRGDIPHEPVWRNFFQNHELEYSLYVHANPDHVYPNGSLFAGREIPSQPSPRFSRGIVDALRRLLANALLDTRYNNAWFVNACESSIPIRSFSFVHEYLVNSTISFVDSFYPVARYHTWDTLPEFNKTDLRKGELWMALRRDHANVVVRDTEIYVGFLAKCTQEHMCTWDEEYIQTLLYLRDADGLAFRTVMYVNWTQPHGGSPKILQSTESVIKELQLRTSDSDGERHDTAFDNTTYECAHNGISPSPCFLFARKFAAGATASLMAMDAQVLGY